MTTKLIQKSYRWAVMPTLLTAALLMTAGSALAETSETPTIVPPDVKFHGRTYGEWSARWWKWNMEFPVQDKHGNPLPHPNFDDPNFDARDEQSGGVWFLAAPFGTVERTATIPHGKALFVGLLNAEASDLEGLGATKAEQQATAEWIADHIVVDDLFFEIDGEAITDLAPYRVVSPQFRFKAPTPWIFGTEANPEGGKGMAVADGYFVLIESLPKGEHTIHYGGSFHFSVAEGDPFDFDASLDMTYHLTVK